MELFSSTKFLTETYIPPVEIYYTFILSFWNLLRIQINIFKLILFWYLIALFNFEHCSTRIHMLSNYHTMFQLNAGKNSFGHHNVIRLSTVYVVNNLKVYAGLVIKSDEMEM